MRVIPAYGMLGLLTIAVGCAGPSTRPDTAIPDGSVGDGPGHTAGTPGLGAHGLAYYKYLSNLPASLSTPAMATQTAGSTIIVGIGRGDNTKFVLPTDNKGNSPYQQLDVMHAYEPYFTESGTALYAYTSTKGGGSDFQVTTATGATSKEDEITLAAVEVVEGTRIQAVAWNQPSKPPIKSGSVTTTGPATLIAFWWGSGFPGTPQMATAGDGFIPIDTNAQETDSFVQCAVAGKNVTEAGTYSVTWTSVPEQGAQLWLIAVQ